MSLSKALDGISDDPTVGPILEFRVVASLKSVDDPSKTWQATDLDRSANLDDPDWASGLKTLTSQIPIIAPARVRHFEFSRSGSGTSLVNGQCIPECGDKTVFPYSVTVNGERAHTANAARISALIPNPGETEHWILENGGGGWDHPIHLHFEEGVTIDRGGASIPVTEKLVRKDVWRLREGGRVRIQVTFGEFGGSYVAHCHNTSHEDFAMLLRWQLLSPETGLGAITKTPMPSPDGVVWRDSEVLPEADPKNARYFRRT
jgi:hypothetical protein